MSRIAVISMVFCLVASAAADTVVLKGGRRIDGVVVSVDGDPVVVNPYNSRFPDMPWGITEKDRIGRDKVESVTVADPPLVTYRERASRPQLSAAEHLELAKFCESHKFEEERVRHLRGALCADPLDTEVLAALGRTNWATWAKGNPAADQDLHTLEQEYLQIQKAEELQPQWEQMVAKGTIRARPYLERARRSAKFPLGRRDKVPLTFRSELSPGATYAIWLPRSYDPLVPTGLVVGLHGGGPGGRDQTLVTGSGESALDFYMDVADAWGFIVVCPTALAAGWQDKKNEPLVDSVLEEMKILYNVDETRIYLTGHSMGGFGAWYWGPHRADVWAAFAPCAGGGGPETGGVPVYIYHGTDDAIVRVDNDRASATVLRDAKKKVDFVYTEIDKVGHGMPDWARKDIFRFFAGRWKDDGAKRTTGPRSSFDRKVSKDEVRCFGNPQDFGPAPSPDDAKISVLIADLQKGGGRGVDAARELASRKDAATLDAVAHVLHSKKATTDAKVLAATALGDMAVKGCVHHLAAETATEDFRLLDAVTEALGKLGGKEVVDPLVRAAKTHAELWNRAGAGGAFMFTEYETRCRSLGKLCDALGAAGDVASALPILDKGVVALVYAPAKPYTVPVDDRFTEIPPRARLDLARHLRGCLVKLRDPRGKALLETVRSAWSAEPMLVKECEAGIAEL